jgi:sporulation integral membrane protein YlbJ
MGMPNTLKYRSRLLAYFMALSAAIITLSMVAYPKEAFDSAITGLNLWWNVVFPSLLPFFVLSEILMGLGVVHFIGVLLEPLMRPLFNVPGIGAFALSMGLASGYPMDAVITCKFRSNKMCTAVEAERLLSFTNTADPLFMFGAVAVGMFGMPELGLVIAATHYLSSLLVGVVFRFHGRSRDAKTPTLPAASSTGILRKALRALYIARQKDRRSLSQLLGDSVKSSMNTILLIGGFIMIFSVLLKILSLLGVTTILHTFFAVFLNAVGFSPQLAPAMVSGLFEIDLGTLAASQANAPLLEKVVIASTIIAWSGLSVHGQVASIVIQSGIRILPYMFARVLHAILAALLTILFMNQSQYISRTLSMPVMMNIDTAYSWTSWMTRAEQGFYQMTLFLGILLAVSLILHIFRRINTYKK